MSRSPSAEPAPLLSDSQLLAFLVEASALLNETLEPATIYARLARLVVPALADRCAILTIDEGGGLHATALAHREPAASPPVGAAPQLEGRPAYVRAILRAEPVLAEPLPPAAAPHRAIIAPLTARGRTLGLIELCLGPSARAYGPADLPVVRELARRAALAADNAHLYAEARAAEAALRDANRDLEARVAARAAELAEAATRFRAAMDSNLDAIFFFRVLRDAGGRVVDFTFADLNRRALETLAELGLTREQLLGRRLCELLPVNRTGGFFEKYLRVFESGVPLEEEFAVDADAPVPSVWRHHQVVPLPDGVAINSRDVSERHRLAEQLRQAQKMEAIGRLAGGVAHDFNNVLTAITGYGEILAADLAAGAAPEPGDVAQILAAARRAAGLTQQLLAFSRKQMLQPEVVSLSAIVAEIEPMLRRLIGEDILLSADLAPDGCLVEVDPGQMQQVILNLAVNARDAMPAGGTLRIATRGPAGHGPARVALVVSDTGLGMSEETRRHLFEPFFTTKERGKGTGLGLSTVYGIVAQSGGEIHVDSAEGAGTTFTVLMPQAAARPAGPPAYEPRGAGRGSELVLLVEDDAAVRGLLEAVMRGEGYQVVSAAGGPQALLVAARLAARVDLLVTDVIMPGMSGAELVRQLEARQPGLRVLYISGYTDDAISPHGVLAPGVAFLQKPFHPADLARKVRAILDAAVVRSP